MKQILAKTALVLLALSMPFAASAQAAIEGHWVNPKGNVVVRLAPCGDAYCGTVIKASRHAQESARNGGTPHLIGTQILTGLRPNGDGTFKGRRVRSQAQHPRTRDDSPRGRERHHREGLRDRRNAAVQGTALDAGQLSENASAPISPARMAA